MPLRMRGLSVDVKLRHTDHLRLADSFYHPKDLTGTCCRCRHDTPCGSGRHLTAMSHAHQATPCGHPSQYCEETVSCTGMVYEEPEARACRWNHAHTSLHRSAQAVTCICIFRSFGRGGSQQQPSRPRHVRTEVLLPRPAYRACRSSSQGNPWVLGNTGRW